MPHVSLPSSEEAVEIPVYGVDCPACANSLAIALKSAPGVRSVEVDVEAERATVRGQGLDVNLLTTRLEELGFSVPQARGQATLKTGWTKLLPPVAIGSAIVAAGLFAFQRAQQDYFTSGGIQSLNVFFSSLSPAAVGLAFFFGLLVAFSPSTLAMAPAVIGSVAASRVASRRQAFLVSVGFVAGVVTVDVALGALFAALGNPAIAFFSSRLPVWYALLTVILLGLALTLLRVWRVPVLTLRLHSSSSARSAYFMGLPFGLIACPGCTPLLLPVALGAAATGNAAYGAALMGAFALGRGIPLVLAGVSTGRLKEMKEFRWMVPLAERAIGLLLLGGAVYFAREFFMVL